MARSNGAEFFARDGMSGKYRPIQLECVDCRQDIVAKAVRIIIVYRRCRPARSTKAPAGEAIDVMVRGEFRSETIENVGAVAIAREKDQRWAASAPVEHFEFDVLVDTDELRLMWRRIDDPFRLSRRFLECDGFGLSGRLPGASEGLSAGGYGAVKRTARIVETEANSVT